MSDAPDHNPPVDVAALLACSPDQWADWMAARRSTLTLALLTALKQHSDGLLHTNPPAADMATRCALLAAQFMDEEPLALPLAKWARGNWEAYHDPEAGIQSYQQAQAGYRAAGDALSVARLAGNLVFAFADSGHFAPAQQSYREAREVFVTLGGEALVYLLLLEQNYGWLLHNQGLYHEALATAERALALAAQIDRPIIAAEVQVNRSLTYAAIGRLAEAKVTLLQARVVAEAYAQLLTIARIDMNLGELEAVQGQPAEALRRLQAAQEQFAGLGNPMEIGSVLLRRAALFERIGALRAARQAYAQAQAQFTTLGMRPQIGIALVRGAAAHRRDGAYTRAAALLDQSDALWNDLGQPEWRTEVLFERAELALQRHAAAAAVALLTPLATAELTLALATRRDILLGEAQARLGNTAAAQALFARALRLAERSGDPWMRRRALGCLGQITLSTDPAVARSYLDAAVAIDDQMRQALSVEELKASFQAQASDLLPIMAAMAADHQQPQQVLRDVWRAKGSALLDLLRATDDNAVLPATILQIEATRQALAARRWQLMAESHSAVIEGPRERQDTEIRRLEHLLFNLRQQRNQPASLDNAAPTDLKSALARMDADILIEYLRCGNRLLAVRAERSGDCQAIWLGEIDPLLELIDRLQLRLRNVVIRSAEQRTLHHAAWIAECLPLLHQAYESLIAPLGNFAPEARLLIAPCDPLYELPFAALWDGECYLVERYELQMTPSGALLTQPPSCMPATDAPVVIATSSEQRLGAIEAEASAIRDAIPDSRILFDEPQALRFLRALPAPPRLLHIAAHSRLREDAPIFSALQLGDEMLSVEECYELPLAGTELVTLSACTTATGLDTGGSLLAFQSAFFIAGARQVINSLWLIDDQATAGWMGRFYQLLAAGLPPPAALRRTQRDLLAAPTSDHPAIWAAFICSRR
jgi:CHAT domain-containing protein/tetratricopeptide (TPR) repeat protein